MARKYVLPMPDMLPEDHMMRKTLHQILDQPKQKVISKKYYEIYSNLMGYVVLQ